MSVDEETVYTVTCSTVPGEAGNPFISFGVTHEQSYALWNLANGVLKRDVQLNGARETVSVKPRGLLYANLDVPGAARGSMMDRRSVIAEMERVHKEAREGAAEDHE